MSRSPSLTRARTRSLMCSQMRHQECAGRLGLSVRRCECTCHEIDPLGPSRGVFVGLCAGLAIWLVAALVIWLVVR